MVKHNFDFGDPAYAAGYADGQKEAHYDIKSMTWTEHDQGCGCDPCITLREIVRQVWLRVIRPVFEESLNAPSTGYYIIESPAPRNSVVIHQGSCPEYRLPSLRKCPQGICALQGLHTNLSAKGRRSGPFSTKGEAIGAARDTRRGEIVECFCAMAPRRPLKDN